MTRSRVGSWSSRSAAGIVLLSFAVGAAEAQQIQGRTVAVGSEAAVGFVDIEVVDSAGRRVGSTTSDWDGRFSVEIGTPGQYQLRTERFGYQPARVDVTVAPDSVSVVVVEVAAAPVQIEGISATAQRGPAIEHTSTYTGLYTRRADPRWATRVGSSRVYVNSDFERYSAMTVRQFIRQNAPTGLGLRGLTATVHLQPGQTLLPAERCRPLYLERGGIHLPAFVVDMILERPVGDFEGIELYSRDYEAPVGLRPDLPSGCGVVVVWPWRKPGER